MKTLGFPNKLGILLYGAPGCGKSSCVAAIATYLHRPVYYVGLKTIQTDRELCDAFKIATTAHANGGVVVLEDIDVMSDVVAPRSGSVSEASSSKDDELTLSCLLNLLQGSLTLDNMVFVATTNHISHLDPALIRDGRFDVKIELGTCDKDMLQSMFQKFFNRKLSDCVLDRFIEDKHIPATLMTHLLKYVKVTDVKCSDADILEPFLHNV
jgi:chaperone BCS1